MPNPEDIITKSEKVMELKRADAVSMYTEGMETLRICRTLKVSDSYVSKWKIVYEKEGAEGLLLKYKGSKGYLSAEKRKEIIGYTEKSEDISTEKLRDYIEENYGVVYKSEQSYYDLLKKGGKSRHKSQKKNPKRDEERVILRREEIKKLSEHEEEIRSGKICVFAEDESHLLRGDTVGYVWGNRNERVEIPIENYRERQTYYGALNLYSGEFILRAYERADSMNTVSFLKYLRKRADYSELLIIWDMAGYHRYSEMKEYLKEINKGPEEKDWKITCIFLNRMLLNRIMLRIYG